MYIQQILIWLIFNCYIQMNNLRIAYTNIYTLRYGCPLKQLDVIHTLINQYTGLVDTLGYSIFVSNLLGLAVQCLESASANALLVLLFTELGEESPCTCLGPSTHIRFSYHLTPSSTECNHGFYLNYTVHELWSGNPPVCTHAVPWGL